MNEYELNYLRWITQGEFPDDVLKTATNFKIEDGKINFKCKMNVSMKDWVHGVGYEQK